MDLNNFTWPSSRLGEAIEALTISSRNKSKSEEVLIVPKEVIKSGYEEINRWVNWAAEHLGVDFESIDTTLQNFEDVLSKINSSILYFEDESKSAFFVVTKSKGSYLYLLGPDHMQHQCKVEHLYEFMLVQHIPELLDEVDDVIAATGIAVKKQKIAKRVLLKDRAASIKVGFCWMLRLSKATPIRNQLYHAGIPQKFIWMLVVLFIVYCIEISGWGIIGKLTLNDRFDSGWFLAWLLLSATLLMANLFSNWIESTFALEVSRLFKERLLFGALNVNVDQVKRMGVGHLLSSVMDSQAIEALIFNGGVGVLIGFIELILAAAILLFGAGGLLHLSLLIIWVIVTVIISFRYFKALESWTDARFKITNQLVESMIGQRTRIAQEPVSLRFQNEDRSMNGYADISANMDVKNTPLVGVLPTGWLILGVIGLAPAFVSGQSTTAELAISLGGILFANRAMNAISGGLTALARAGVAWKHIVDFFNSVKPQSAFAPFALRREQTDFPQNANPQNVLEIANVDFQYHQNAPKLLSAINFSLRYGERILLEGGSGSGKSTLASLMVGLRKPSSGLILLNGLDKHTLGDAWHKAITESPQFHENHIFNGSLGFNLLMGKNWPASESDLDEAAEICSELGLDDLISRMPAGLMQTVGETGWQLSHGEKSRIFLARALLQSADITVLDESFAALDPETLKLCLNCATSRAKTLIVIAHP
jgi:ATP-binding cassette subfamily B protein